MRGWSDVASPSPLALIWWFWEYFSSGVYCSPQVNHWGSRCEVVDARVCPELTLPVPRVEGMIVMSRYLSSFLGVFLLLAFLAAPLASQEEMKPPVPTHDPAGKENCLMCHAPGVMPPVPDTPVESHEGRANEHCMWCHAADSPMQTTGASKTSHDLEGKDNCLMCHAPGVMPPATDIPAETHEARANETCLWCHTHEGGFPGS